MISERLIYPAYKYELPKFVGCRFIIISMYLLIHYCPTCLMFVRSAFGRLNWKVLLAICIVYML